MGDPSQWTVVTLKEYFEQLRRDDQQALQAALASQKEAILKAEAASEKRFEGVNEFRNTLSDQQRTLMPRQETEIRLNTLDREHDELKSRLAAMESRRAGQAGGWGWAVAVVMLAFTVYTVLTR